MENIHVSLRLRPLSEKEIKQNEKIAWEVSDSNTIQAINDNAGNQNTLPFGKQLSFNYDKCFDEAKTNKQVYESCVQSILKSSLNGVNGTIFMYGQSGSGKTYTMMGYEKKLNSNGSQPTLGFQQNPQLSIYNYTSGQTQQNQQMKKKNLSQNSHSLSPISKGNNGSGICQLDIDDIDFERIKSNTPDDNKGILMLALQDFFDTIKKDEDKTYVVKCSYVEIYNDQIYDLLNPISKLNEILQVGLNQNKEFYIKGVTQESVSTLEEAYEVLRKGETNKHYAQTTMNHHSSRSHSIFKLYVQSISSVLLRSCMPRRSNANSANQQIYKNINNQEILSKLGEHDSTLISTSELNFIDLAGSEKVSNHSNLEEILLNSGQKNQQSSSNIRDQSPQDLIKDRVKEGQFINKSLFFLTQVISQIAEGKPLTHIPYRNSPLTKILKSSLGGNSRTMIILCITPVQSQFEQSYSTIRFGLNAKKIENKVRVNIQAKNNEEALQLLILDYEKKIQDLEQQRYEEKTKNAELIKKLNELSYQNQQIQQKLMNSNKKNMELSQNKNNNFNGEGICQNCQKSNQNSSSKGENKNINQKSNFQKQEYNQKRQKWMNEKQQELLNEQCVHCDYVGVLFPTRNNILVSDVCSQVKRNWQDLVFDYEGRYAFHQYQVRNKQFASYLQMWDKVNNNITRVTDHHLKVYECAQNIKNSLKNYEGSLKNVVDKLNTKTASQQTTNTQQLQNSNLPYLVNLGQITFDEILNLERTIYSSQQKIIQEKFRRNVLQNMEANSQKNTIPQNEKQKFTSLLNLGNNKSDQQIMIEYPNSEKLKRQHDQLDLDSAYLNNNKTKNELNNIPEQNDTSIEDIKRYLKDNDAFKNSYQLIQNTLEQERDLLKQLFYKNVDIKSISEVSIDWNEADFKHLKSIITKSSYSHLNIFDNGKNDSTESNKRLSYNTPNINKFKNKGEADKKNNLSYDDDQNNLKKAKIQQFAYNSASNQQNILSNYTNNNSTLEEKLQYHQNPIPKEQEEEIQQNYEKLQNQSCFFDGYSTISNVQSNYIPSNTSFHQNIITSQKLINNFTNQIGGNLNTIIQSNAPSNSNNNSNGNIHNFISVPPQINTNLYAGNYSQQYSGVQNYLPAQTSQKNVKDVGQFIFNQYQSNVNNVTKLNNLCNQNYESTVNQVVENKYLKENLKDEVNSNNINIHDTDSAKNPLSSIKLNTNSIPDSLSLNNVNLLDSSKQSQANEGTDYTQQLQTNYQINPKNEIHTRSHSAHQHPSYNQNKQILTQKNQNNEMYYFGQQQQNKIDNAYNKTLQNTLDSQLENKNGLNFQGLPKSFGNNMNQFEISDNFKKDFLNGNIPPRNFEKKIELNKINQEQSFEKQLRHQDMPIQNQNDVVIQQYLGINKKINSLPPTPTNETNNFVGNNNSLVVKINQNPASTQKLINTQNLLQEIDTKLFQKDIEPESYSHKRSESVHQDKSYQKIIGNIYKDRQNINDPNSILRDNYQNTSKNNSITDITKSQINQIGSRQDLEINTLSSRQNCYSAQVTPKKQPIKLNNTISIDIIQLQSTKAASSKPFVFLNKQGQFSSKLNSNSLQNTSNVSIGSVENRDDQHRRQSYQLHSTGVQNDRMQKDPLSQLNSNSSYLNTGNNMNYLSNINYSGNATKLSDNNKDFLNQNSKYLEQILQKQSPLNLNN